MYFCPCTCSIRTETKEYTLFNLPGKVSGAVDIYLNSCCVSDFALYNLKKELSILYKTSDLTENCLDKNNVILFTIWAKLFSREYNNNSRNRKDSGCEFLQAEARPRSVLSEHTITNWSAPHSLISVSFLVQPALLAVSGTNGCSKCRQNELSIESNWEITTSYLHEAFWFEVFPKKSVVDLYNLGYEGGCKGKIDVPLLLYEINYINNEGNDWINKMNSENENGQRHDQAKNGETTNASENSVQNPLGETPSQRNFDSNSGPESDDKVTAYGNSSSSYDPLTTTTMPPSIEPVSPSNSASNDSENGSNVNGRAVASSSGRAPYGSDNYSALKQLGISRRKKTFSSLDNDGNYVDYTETSSNSYKPYQSSVIPTMNPWDSSGKTYSPQADNDPHKSHENTSTALPSTNSNAVNKSPVVDGSSESSAILGTNAVDITSCMNKFSMLKMEEEKFVKFIDLESLTSSTDIDDTSIVINSSFLTSAEKRLEELTSLGECSAEEMPSPAEERLWDVRSPKMAPKITFEEALSLAVLEAERLKSEQSTDAESDTTASISVEDSEGPIKSKLSTMKTEFSHSKTTTSLKMKIIESDYDAARTYHSRSPNSSRSGSPVSIGDDDGLKFTKSAPRRSSSLKIRTNSPDSSRVSKAVRFADALGLDLESVRQVANSTSPPIIPASVLASLAHSLDDQKTDVGTMYLSPCFSQPGAEPNFIQKVHSQKVCLENVLVTDMTIRGFVRVVNISYHKSVLVMYTHNSWHSVHEVTANYLYNSCDGPTDRFSFIVVAPPYLQSGSRLELVVLFVCDGIEYKDNQDGKNYVFECLAKPTSTDSSEG